MPTVIDSLVVTLGLDAKNFNEQQKQSVKYLQEMEGAVKRHGGNATRGVNEMVTAFRELQGRLLAVGALIAAGLGFNRLTQDVTKAATALGQMSTTLNMAAQDIDSWEKMGKTVGAASGEMAQGLAAINTEIQKLKYYGTSELSTLMGQLGMKSIGPNEKPEDVAKRLSQFYQGYKDKAGLQNLLKSHGVPQGMVNALALGPEELQKRLDAAKRIAPTDEEISKFQALTKAFGDVLNVVERLTQQALLPFITTMTKILNMLTDWLTKWATQGQSPPAAAGDAMGKLGMGELKSNPSKPGLFQRGWNWMMGRSNGDNGEAAAAGAGGNGGGGAGGGGGGAGGNSGGSSGSGSSAAPGGVSSGGAAYNATPNGTLAEQRQRFAQELEANPELKDKVMRIMANEQGRNPEGTQAVAESMMNRALVRGHGLEQAARWYKAEQGGYYEMGNMGRGSLENPRHKAVLEQSLQNALSGSNVSNYATDNASQGLAERHKQSGRFRYRSGYGGESFFAPGSAEPGRAQAWDRWHQGVTASEAARNSGRGTPGMTGAGKTFEMWQGLGLGKGGPMRSGDTNNNTKSSSLSIGNMNVTVPPGADPSAYADGISRRLGDWSGVADSNTGLV